MGGLLLAYPPHRLTAPSGWQNVGMVWRIFHEPSFGGFLVLFPHADDFKVLLMLMFALQDFY